jgi:putative flippase GtrA
MCQKIIDFKKHLTLHKTKYAKVLRYITSGGTAAFFDLLILHILVEYFYLWYILSSIIAFLMAFLVSFVMQKFWTFQELSSTNIHRQITLHFFLGIINLTINTVALYILVDSLHLHYMPSQIFISGSLAVMSFFIYKLIIFRK